MDESFIVPGPDGPAMPRPGNVGAPVDPSATTRVVEFNDLDALERELAHGDVAAVLMEPALTNIGIVLPEPGYLDGGPRADPQPRHAADQRRDPHVLAPVPAAAPAPGTWTPTSSRSASRSPAASRPAPTAWPPTLADRMLARRATSTSIDTGGVGGTLAGNALSVAAMRATLEQVLTDAAFQSMIALRRPATRPASMR